MRFPVHAVLNPHWTDLAVVMGPDMRWVHNDVEDLLRFAPEVLLGYRVRVTTPDDAVRMKGHRIAKLVLLDGLDFTNRKVEHAVQDLRHQTYGHPIPTKTEIYRVHRALDPVVERLL